MFKKLILISIVFLNLNALHFTVNVRGECDGVCDNTVLIFGGIQGDEPGGFHAASLLLTNYEFKKGKVVVVPNLAFDSIIARNRGNFGDLNRKFANLNSNDPDYETIQLIKQMINFKEVKLIINLHDGSGYYSPKYINKLKNPNKWGNSCIIDQESIDAKYGNLEENATATCNEINKHLLKKLHSYNVHNTHTAKGDVEMLKSLTYYAITQGKAAYANEASKELLTHERAYYHLLAIEHYLRLAGVEFSRDFKLTPNDVKRVIEQPIYVNIDDRYLLKLDKSKNLIKDIPLRFPFTYKTSNELTAIFKTKDLDLYSIQYGNRFQSNFSIKEVEYSDLIGGLKLVVDGVNTNLNFAQEISIKHHFMISKQDGVEFKLIGYKGDTVTNVKITLNDLDPLYSIDKAGRLYRLEAYDGEKFIGQVLLSF